MNNEVTRILLAVEQGDPNAAAQLLPLMYDELRKLAARRLSSESPGQTLQATALVHEAYLQLVGSGGGQQWDGRRHFFAAAAEALGPARHSAPWASGMPAEACGQPPSHCWSVPELAAPTSLHCC